MDRNHPDYDASFHRGGVYKMRGWILHTPSKRADTSPSPAPPPLGILEVIRGDDDVEEGRQSPGVDRQLTATHRGANQE